MKDSKMRIMKIYEPKIIYENIYFIKNFYSLCDRLILNEQKLIVINKNVKEI